MDVKRFALFTFIGAMIWNSVLAVSGYFLGSLYFEVARSLDGWDLVIIAVVIVAFITYVLYGRWKNKKQPHCEE
jgi:membrane protein DedA with SNARE-associated domain